MAGNLHLFVGDADDSGPGLEIQALEFRTPVLPIFFFSPRSFSLSPTPSCFLPFSVLSSLPLSPLRPLLVSLHHSGS